MEKDKGIFRREALDNFRTEPFGQIVLIRPVSFAFLAAFFGLVALVLLLFFFFASYTKRTTVSGQLVPDLGLVQIHARQSGVIAEKHVTEGQFVRKGDVLFIIDSEVQSRAQGEVQAAISAQLTQVQHSLQMERSKMAELQDRERVALINRIDALDDELNRAQIQAADLATRVTLAEQDARRFEQLAAEGFVSQDQLRQRQEQAIDQRTRLNAIERETIILARDLAAYRNDLAGLQSKQENQLAQIDRALAQTAQDLSQSEARRSLLVTAPESGTATTVLAEVGQTVDAARILVNIVPEGSQLLVHLYAPSRAAGFVQAGDDVRVRYQAFPYQKFGQYPAVVKEVSKIALPAGDLAGFAMGVNPAGAGEPAYRIVAELRSQYALAYGEPQSLQAGMLLEAHVMQDTRKLYEWVLEPLYSLSGSLH